MTGWVQSTLLRREPNHAITLLGGICLVSRCPAQEPRVVQRHKTCPDCGDIDTQQAGWIVVAHAECDRVRRHEIECQRPRRVGEHLNRVNIPKHIEGVRRAAQRVNSGYRPSEPQQNEKNELRRRKALRHWKQRRERRKRAEEY